MQHLHNTILTRISSVDYSSGDGVNNLWQPRDVLLRNDGDISLMFLSANNIKYYDQVKDPIFNATDIIKTFIDNGKNVSLYTSFYWVTAMGCVDQHQFCNPVNNKCTKLDSHSSAVREAQKSIQLNSMQHYAISVLSRDLYLSIVSRSESLGTTC